MPILRLATPDDHPALAMLFAEMQAHYRAPCPEQDDILAGLAGRPAGAELLLAEDNGSLLAFAAFAPIYPGPALQPASSSRSSMSRPQPEAAALAAR
jgi:hypothetical protein